MLVLIVFFFFILTRVPYIEYDVVLFDRKFTKKILRRRLKEGPHWI